MSEELKNNAKDIAEVAGDEGASDVEILHSDDDEGTETDKNGIKDENGKNRKGKTLADTEARMELKRLVEEQAREDERPLSANFTLRKILGGEFLTAKILRQQLGLIMLVVAFTIVYISNRYSCDKQRIEIAKLSKELEEARFRAMSSTSDLTEVSRESNVLEMLRQNKDSVLHIPSQPPYIINVPEQ